MKVARIRLDSGEMSKDLKNNVDCLNRSYASLEIFTGSDIACKYTGTLNIR